MKLKDLFSVVTGNELIDVSIEDEPRYRFDFWFHCWKRILNPELLDYEVTEIHTSLRNDNPMLVVWIKAQNSDN